MDWTRILAYITGSVDQELLLRNGYLAAENRILRAQLNGCLRLSDAERATLGEIGFRLGRKALSEVRPSPRQTPFWHGTEGSSLANSRDREHVETGGDRGSTEKSKD
jgi:hypothetical protein